MNLHTLLADAVDGVDTDVPPPTVGADVQRGRRALLRRRARRGGIAGVAVLGAAAVLTVLPGASHDSAPAVAEKAGIALVDYAGDQPAGYTVDSMPRGWNIQGSNADYLTIAADDDPNTDPSWFPGKLLVTLQSKDAPMPVAGPDCSMAQYGATCSAVTVGDAPGVLITGEQADPALPAPNPEVSKIEGDLFFVDPASGLPVEVQYPTSLHWTPEQVAEFAAGVHITKDAHQLGG